MPLPQEVCACLGARDAADIVALTLTSDKLSGATSPYDVTPAVLAELTAWWRRRMPAVSPQLTGPGGDDLYVDMVAR